ncbi:MAG: hypothetical protein JNG88_05040 [Phycisphaerales bacterium]|nr:hypothetical protein [Phycisphaerales bacterium]
MKSKAIDLPVQQALMYASASCLCLGVCLLVWGLMPAVIERTVSGTIPRAETFLMGSISFLIGASYIGLCLLIQRTTRWALLAAYLLSLGIVTAWVSNALLNFNLQLPTFLVLMSGTTMYGCWLGLRAVRQAACVGTTQSV